VAFVDGVEVGHAVYSQTSERFVVKNIWIKPSHRGQGHGRELALELGARMHAAGLSQDAVDYSFVDRSIVAANPEFKGFLNEVTGPFAEKMIEEYDA
jgi:ribosomal protein S18 acetylase RimI-like enzyme